MRRWILVVMAASMMGCSSLSFKNPFAAKKPADSVNLSDAQWASLKQENAKRLRGEGIPPRGEAATQPVAQGAQGQFDEFLGFVKFTFWELPKRLIAFYSGKTPGVYARMMEDDQSADQRRTGILRLVADYDFARKDPYTRRYWQIAQGDPDRLVRVAGVRALNRSRDASITPIAIKYLDDQETLIRLEAAKALANLPDPKAVNPLIKHLGPMIELRGEGGRLEAQPESRDVRVACADALRNYPTRDVAKALIDMLKEREFEVSYQARKSLILMTGHDFRYDVEAWRTYFSKSDKPFG